MLLKLNFACALGFLVVAASVRGDVVELKEKSSVTGKVLTEKRDSVVVDLGYTVLVIPREHISKIISGDATPSPSARPAQGKTAPEKKTTPEVKRDNETVAGLYRAVSGGLGRERFKGGKPLFVFDREHVREVLSDAEGEVGGGVVGAGGSEFDS